jgi:hypothetical protein
MEQLFVRKTSAIQRIMTAKHALLQEKEAANQTMSASERQIRVTELVDLLFGVRHDTLTEFTLRVGNRQIQIFVTPD